MTAALTAASRVGMTLVLGVVTAGGAIAQRSGSEARTVEGTWYIQVTPIVCATGAPVPGVTPVTALVTFHSGGTMSETAGGTGFAPGQRSQGHGNWHHEGGQTFSQKFTALINFTTVPNFQEAGWQTVEQSVVLLDRDTLSSAGTNAFYRTNGTVYRSGCSTATGRRFE